MSEIVKPGCYMWGGSDGWQFGQKIPNRAIEVWERDNDWVNQHHLLEIDLSSYYDREGRGIADYRGLDLQINLAKRIIDGGGEVQLMCWATPAHLSSVPLTWNDGGRASWMKYKPKVLRNRYGRITFDGNLEWAKILVTVLRRIMAKVPSDRLWIGIGMEAHRFKFRNPVSDFLNFVDIVQKELRTVNNLVHIGMTQVPDLIDGQLGRMQHFIPTFDFIERYLNTARQKNWRVDFIPLFEYSGDAERMRSYIQQAWGLLNLCGFGSAEIIWNGLSPEANIRDTQMGVEKSIEVGKMLLEEGVNRACWDFLEDSEPETATQHDNGLLTYQTLAPRPRYELAKRVCNMNGF